MERNVGSPAACTTRGAPSARTSRRSRSARARSSGSCPGRGRCGPNTAPTSGVEREAPSRRASSQPGAGVASWVRNAITSPLARSAARLRVRPCPNSAGAISSTVAPAARAISSDPSRRARVDHEHLVDAPRARAREHLAQVARPVLDGDDRRDALAHRARRRGSLPATRRASLLASAARSAAAPRRRASGSGRCRQRSSQ